ncbi:auxin response factor 4-like isoform X2 [Malania oleifera]|uniref:auxin response factor 4-like isoform X2 n=1 Tax=Malania oleifera TaxID=397392 RepID=UPI0025AE9F1F|nr:auxin response factor 4-like isoform X2 [Malania oleifera]
MKAFCWMLNGSRNANATTAPSEKEEDQLYTALWHACAGPLVSVPRIGEKVFYFPQGHMEQLEAYANQDSMTEMPIYNLSPKILCKVVNVLLEAETYSDEVYAQIMLLPVDKLEESDEENETPRPQPQPIRSSFFTKILTPSDTSSHGGFSVPKRQADECLPPLDMSQQPPVQELVATDLHGFEWRFRHIYRGQPKRHLLTSGWSTFVTSKKLVAGDACIFIRGENEELRVGIRHVTELYNSAPTALLSGQSMQHGILASAVYAISARSMFTVYYRPWTCPSEFIIPCSKFIKAAENYFSVGTRFRMAFEGEESKEQRYVGTVVGIEDIDHIRWPGSEWRCLKVQWDDKSDAPVRPERISPWEVEPIEFTNKNKNHTSILPQPKKPRPLKPSASRFSPMARDGLLKSSVRYRSQDNSGVLHGHEIAASDTHELGTLEAPLKPHEAPTPSSNWSHMQMGVGNDQLPFPIHAPLYQCSSKNPDRMGLAGPWSPIFTSYGMDDIVGVCRSALAANFNSEYLEWRASGEKDGDRAQPGCDKYKLFGVNIYDSQVELPSPQFEANSELHNVSSIPLTSQSSIMSEARQVSEPSKGTSILPEKQCEDCCCIANRSCTKVLKHGTALGRSVDLTHFNGYDELICELDKMFEFNGGLIDGGCGWHVTYRDNEGDMMLIGSYPWQEFRAMVRKILIYPKEETHKQTPSIMKL